MTIDQFNALPDNVQVLRLRLALQELIELQSHYASLLNEYDAGQRREFGSADEWILRLYETGTLPRRDEEGGAR
jgi:hypothetical protein